MSDLPPVSYIPLTATLQDVLTAHEAIRAGIATHAEKEHGRRLQARRELQAADRLRGTGGTGGK